MTHPQAKPNVLPPRLSMDEYCEFIETALRDIKPEQAARQKALEEQIRDRFSMAEGPAPVFPPCPCQERRRS